MLQQLQTSQPPLRLIAPVIALILWTFVIGLYLLACRLPIVIKHNKRIPPGVTKEQSNKNYTPQQRWRADNYNHLHEAPTIFYAVTLALAFLRVSDGYTASFAWLYVAARIVHSLIQVTTNIIVYRFAVFVTSQVFLSALVGRAVLSLYEQMAWEA